MHKLLKQSMILFIALSLMMTAFGTAAMAQSAYPKHQRTGEKMAVDAVLLRPAGLLATVLGSIAFVVSVPFSALGGNTKEAYEEMVKKPARYTFKRQLGDF